MFITLIINQIGYIHEKYAAIKRDLADINRNRLFTTNLKSSLFIAK